MDKDILVDWKEWKKGSKNYINSHREIDLKLVINEYQLLGEEFLRLGQQNGCPNIL